MLLFDNSTSWNRSATVMGSLIFQWECSDYKIAACSRLCYHCSVDESPTLLEVWSVFSLPTEVWQLDVSTDLFADLTSHFSMTGPEKVSTYPIWIGGGTFLHLVLSVKGIVVENFHVSRCSGEGKYSVWLVLLATAAVVMKFQKPSYALENVS